MRVGFDLSVIRHGLVNGSAVYAYRLARALLELPNAPDLIFYFGARASEKAESLLADLYGQGAPVVRGPAPWRWSPDAGWWLPIHPPIREMLRSVDVFHAGDLLLPPPTATPCVATVYDVTTVLFPEQHLRWNRWLHARRLRWIRRHAARVLTCSANTRADLERTCRISADRIDVIYGAQGHDTTPQPVTPDAAARIRARFALQQRPYVLSVGTLEPRKNHERLIRAFEGLSHDSADLQLVLVGGWGWRAEGIRKAVAQSLVRDRIHVVGQVSTEEMSVLYAGATALAFPSMYEGFGFPVLEAMSAGVAVLTSNVSSLPEVAGDAAILVDPYSVDAIRNGLRRLICDPPLRTRLAASGIRRSQEFTWRRTAELALECYRRAAAPAVNAAEPGAG